MIELLPTLFAQQQLKQAATPIPPIEPTSVTQPQSSAPAITPNAAIAIPESVSIPIPVPPAPVAATPAPSPTATRTSQSVPVTSKVALPQVPAKAALPQVPQTAPASTTPDTTTQTVDSQTVDSQTVDSQTVDSQTVDSQSKPTAAKPTSTAQTELTEKPTSRTALPSVTSTAQRSSRSTGEPVVETNSAPSTPASQTDTARSIEIPVPQPTLQATPQSPIQAQKQLLEQRLAGIVSKDRAIKQAQRDSLVSRAYDYATQRRFAQARKLLQDPTIPADVRDQILNNINSLESASRAIGVTQIKESATRAVVPAKKPTRSVVALKPPAVFTGVTSRTPQQSITIQVPQAIQSLPIQQKSPLTDPTASIASDSATGYIDQLGSDQVVNPKNLQAFNRNLPKLTSAGQILYPLPEPVPVTSRFGWRRHPVTGVRRFHSGVDLGAGQGTPVIASRAGKVVSADRLGGYGLAIVLQQPDGSQDTLYAHLSQIFVRPGEQIKPGTIIGRVGSTGLSTGPHLHYEARRMSNTGWVAVDPGGQLEAARVRLVQARQTEARSSRSNSGS